LSPIAISEPPSRNLDQVNIHSSLKMRRQSLLFAI
jgi:hypothetical protein